MNERDEARGAEGIEIPDEVDLDAGGIGKSKLIPAIIIAAVIVVQAISANFIVKKVFFSKPSTRAKTEERLPMGDVYNLSSIIVNPTGTKGTKHLLIDLGLETQQVAVLAELSTLEPQLRDNLITFLSAQKVGVLTDIKMRDKIRERIQEIVNYYLVEGEVSKVYFISYVFQ